MDYNKIGNFIATERKEKKLTQAKLAEKLFISEKTISKWENGNGIPDTNSLPKLCEILDVTINELLNGERIATEDYKNKAENNLLTLKKQKEESDKRLLISEILIGSISTAFFIAMLFVSLYAIYELNILVVPIILMVLGFIIFIVGCSYCLYIEQIAGYYYCSKCGFKHVPTYTQVFLAPHINRTRCLKCPRCNKRCWHKKVIK